MKYKLSPYPYIQQSLEKILSIDEHFVHINIGEFYIIYDKSVTLLLSSALILNGINGVYNYIIDTLHISKTNITKFDLVKLEYLLNNYHIYPWN